MFLLFCASIAVASNLVLLPGNWMILGLALLASALTGWHAPPWPVLAGMAAIVLLGEWIERRTAQRYGPARGRTLLAFAGALVAARMTARTALRPVTRMALRSAFVRAAGPVIKIVGGMLMWLILAVSAWPWR